MREGINSHLGRDGLSGSNNANHVGLGIGGLREATNGGMGGDGGVALTNLGLLGGVGGLRHSGGVALDPMGRPPIGGVGTSGSLGPGPVGGTSQVYDPSRVFEPVNYRELAAATLHGYMKERELSSDPDIRQYAHFEGYLNSQRFNQVNNWLLFIYFQFRCS